MRIPPEEHLERCEIFKVKEAVTLMAMVMRMVAMMTQMKSRTFTLGEKSLV